MVGNDYVACIITFNPDIKILKQCIKSVLKQIGKVIIWDNNSNNIAEIVDITDSIRENEVLLWKHKKNYGIAKALNTIFEYAYESGYSWLLTLDQDSVVPSNMMCDYGEFTDYPNVGIIGCRTPDRNAGPDNYNGPKIDIANELITSGSLTNVNIWKKIGGFDENLFIDSVDKDYCINLIASGYILIRVNSVALSHTIGSIRIKNLFGKNIVIYNHSPFRKYHQIRNMVYLNRKYKKIHTMFALRHFFIGLFKILFFEDEKSKKIKSWIKGFVDGAKVKL